MRKANKGFTLIELIVVIVILGILAATALPKFVDIGGDARKAAMSSAEGAMRAANGMIYAKAAAQGKLGATNSGGWVAEQISFASATLSVLGGYAYDISDLSKAMDLSASDFQTVTSSSNVGTDNGALQHKKATSPSTCEVAYQNFASSGTSTPAYTFTNTGC